MIDDEATMSIPSTPSASADLYDDSSDDFASLLEPIDGSGGSLTPGGYSLQTLYPQADRELVRLESEHAISMMELRHEQEITALRQDAREQLRRLRAEVRRRDKALTALTDERDTLAAQLASTSAELAPYPAQLAAARRSDAKHKQQLATTRLQAEHERASLEHSMQALRERLELAAATERANLEQSMQVLRERLELAAATERASLEQSMQAQRERLELAAATERASLEQRLEALRERLEPQLAAATARATESERTAAELRKELEAAHLAHADAQRSAAEAREKLQGAWLEASRATAASELLAERVAMLQRESERLGEQLRLAHQAEQQRSEELRETCAALAGVREQRNQLAREAEASRLAEVEARDELAAGLELAGAGEARVAAAERRTLEEHEARVQAEGRLMQHVEEQRATRSLQQRRMLALLLRASRVQMALGLTKWKAGVAAVDALDARRASREAAELTAAVRQELQEHRRTVEMRDFNFSRGRALNGAIRSALDGAYARHSATAAFGRWALATSVQARCAEQWASLSQRAERAGAERAPWRLLLSQRRRLLKLQTRRCQTDYAQQHADTRLSRAVFVVWRLSTQVGVLRELIAAEEGRYAPVHVGPGPWWEAK